MQSTVGARPAPGRLLLQDPGLTIPQIAARKKHNSILHQRDLQGQQEDK